MQVNINGEPFFRITSQFQAKDTPLRSYPHTGIDLATYEGTPLPSTTDGTVVEIYREGQTSLGNGIKIEAPDGTEIIYGHLLDTKVSVGDKVNIGEIIGRTGNTGNSSGAHLHLGAKFDGQFINPQEYVDILQNLAHELLDKAWMTVNMILNIGLL